MNFFWNYIYKHPIMADKQLHTRLQNLYVYCIDLGTVSFSSFAFSLKDLDWRLTINCN